MLKVKHIGEYSFIYNAELKPSKDIFSKCSNFMYSNKNCGLMAPMIQFKNNVRSHNYRNFPHILDLLIKNIPVLRRRFPSRMRRFLLWDLRMDTVSNVDFVTSNFMCVRKCLLDDFGDYNISKNFFDIKLCAHIWSKQFEVCYNPVIKLNVNSSENKRTLFNKLFMLTSAFGLQIYMWFRLKGCNFPSRNYKATKQMLMNAHKINSRSFLSSIGSNFQKNNSVVQVYEGKVSGHFSYNQPLVFCYDGVIALIKNSRGEYGLIKIWRHSPLKQSVPNLFPVFPDTQDLGVYSYECVRGGGEKYDSELETSILRELKEEINLTPDCIDNIKQLSNIVGNTAWDIGRSYVFLIEISNDFDVKVQTSESIESFDFYSKSEILKLIQENKIICGLTKAALLEDILENA